MMGPAFGYMPDYMGWMMAGSLLFWLLVVVLGFVVLFRLARPAGNRGEARAILDARLARGEIDAEEYRSRLAVLTG